MAARSLALGDKLLTLGGYDEAIRHYRMVLAFNPAPSIRAKLLENMAYAYHTLGKHLEAASNAKDALDIDTDNVSAWSTLGLSLQKLGEDGQAEKCFREAVKIDPHDGSLWLNLVKFPQYNTRATTRRQSPRLGKRWSARAATIRQRPATQPNSQPRKHFVKSNSWRKRIPLCETEFPEFLEKAVDRMLRPDGRHNRPISAHFQGMASLRVSATILVRRLERRSRRLRAAPSGKARRNISSTC